MSDIVDRLRMLKTSAAWFCDETEATLEDAAAEIERLRAERDEALADWRAEMSMHRDEHQRRMRAQAERDRLREAVQILIANVHMHPSVLAAALDIASTALKETGHD
jgi:hypothetical protein